MTFAQKLTSFKLMLLLVVGPSLSSPPEKKGEKVAEKDKDKEQMGSYARVKFKMFIECFKAMNLTIKFKHVKMVYVHISYVCNA